MRDMTGTQKRQLIEQQCKHCVHFEEKTEECTFVLSIFIPRGNTPPPELAWFRKNQPEDIELIEECNMAPAKVAQNDKRVTDNVVIFQQ
jgi:hypothetical protein